MNGRGFCMKNKTIFSHLSHKPLSRFEQDLAPGPRIIGAVAKASQGLFPLPFLIRVS